MHWWSRAQTSFRTQRGKIAWSTACSIFVPCTTMVALQSDCFMRMMSRTAMDRDQKWLSSWSAMQETKPGRTRAQPAKEASTSVCFWAWKLTVWSSWGFQMSTRLSHGYLRLTEASCFCESLFLGIWKLREGRMIPATSRLSIALS